jgi:hypothetical protein
MPEDIAQEARPFEDWQSDIASYDPGTDAAPAADVQERIEDRLTVTALPILEAYRRVAELKGEHEFWGKVEEGSGDDRVKEFATSQRVQLVEELKRARQELVERRTNDTAASAALMVLQNITKT